MTHDQLSAAFTYKSGLQVAAKKIETTITKTD